MRPSAAAEVKAASNTLPRGRKMSGTSGIREAKRSSETVTVRNEQVSRRRRGVSGSQSWLRR